MGRHTIYDRLNVLTKAAAKLEHFETRYETFSDVIHFNEETNTFFFSNLWKGDPPMAPINLGYSQCAQDLKKALVNLIKTRQQLSTFSVIERRICSIWKAVLKENFVFNFKNTLEVNAYSILDAQYGKWCWSLQRLLGELLIEIDNKVKLRDDTIFPQESSHIQHCQDKLYAHYQDLIKALNSFVENHDLSQILIKWKMNIQARLEEMYRECTETIKNHCTLLIEQKQHLKKLDKILLKYEKQLREGISLLKPSLDFQMLNKNDDEIKKLFEIHWKRWTEDFKKTVTELKNYNDDEIEESVILSLSEKLRPCSSMIKSKLEKCSLASRKEDISNYSMVVDPELHISITKVCTVDIQITLLLKLQNFEQPII